MTRVEEMNPWSGYPFSRPTSNPERHQPGSRQHMHKHIRVSTPPALPGVKVPVPSTAWDHSSCRSGPHPETLPAPADPLHFSLQFPPKFWRSFFKSFLRLNVPFRMTGIRLYLSPTMSRQQPIHGRRGDLAAKQLFQCGMNGRNNKYPSCFCLGYPWIEKCFLFFGRQQLPATTTPCPLGFGRTRDLIANLFLHPDNRRNANAEQLPGNGVGHPASLGDQYTQAGAQFSRSFGPMYQLQRYLFHVVGKLSWSCHSLPVPP